MNTDKLIKYVIYGKLRFIINHNLDVDFRVSTVGCDIHNPYSCC